MVVLGGTPPKGEGMEGEGAIVVKEYKGKRRVVVCSRGWGGIEGEGGGRKE